MLNIAVLVSGGGTNLQALINAQENGIIKNGKITLVISSKENVYAIERAKKNNINHCVLKKDSSVSPLEYGNRLISKLQSNNIDLVILAGFTVILAQNVIDAYKNRIINVHPSLIPSFCGEGFYGLRPHQAALERGVKLTGATVHFVNNIPDGGKILAQKAVEVLENDTAEVLQKRVMQEAEWILLPKVTQEIALQLDSTTK